MISKGFPTKSIKEILQDLNEESIARQYLGITTLPEVMCSPLRQDRTPSFSIYENSKGRIYFKDFGTGDSGSLYDLLGKLWNTDFNGVIQSLLSNSNSSQFTVNRGVHSYKKKLSIDNLKVVGRDWKQWDLDYWESFGINKEWLEFGDVHPISTLIMDKGGCTISIPCEKYAYVYVERKDGKVSYKIYQPFSESYKWMSKHDSSVWDLWTQLPECGDNLIITSSRKDALCIWSNSGIPSVSLQGEGYMPKEKVIDELKSRFKNIYILYDNDFNSEENHGRIFGKIISDKYNLKQIEIPINYKCKDMSDVCKMWGRQAVYELVCSLIN